VTTSMSVRPPQPPAKQFILRQRATDAELLELYRQRDDVFHNLEGIARRVKAFLEASEQEHNAEKEVELTFNARIHAARQQVEIPVIAVMDPSKNTKTLYYPEDTSFKNPIETVPMKPEDYELPLL